MIAIIDVISTRETKKEELENDLFWYDHIDKGMRRFKGGKLVYEYVEFPDLDVLVPDVGWISGKTVAKADKVYKSSSVIKNNADKIKEWISINKEEFQIETEYIDNKEIIISFDDKNKDDVDSSLFAKAFRYEIRDN